MFHSSADVLVVADERGTIVLVNDACERVLGYAAGSLIGRPVETLVPSRFTGHGRMRDGFMSHPRNRAMGGGVLLFAAHASGVEVPVDISLTPIEVEGEKLVVCALRDMRGRVNAPETLRVQATALRSAANGIVITDRNGTIVWVNPAACTITGYDPDELVGQHTRILKSGEHDGEFYRALWNTICAGDTWSGTIVNRRKDGSLYSEEQTIAPVVDEAGQVSHFIAIKQDVTARRKAEEALRLAHEELAEKVRQIESLNLQLREQAIRDPLTGLHNRRFFEEVAALEIARALRRAEPISVLILDVDHFKRINDDHGHDAGDLALQRVAGQLRRHAREADLVCRFGGEEFVCVLTGADHDTALVRAEEWRAVIERTEIVTAAGTVLHCTVSIGVASLVDRGETMASALKRADAALYEAKRRGRNRVFAAI
jgi:diguanylate cyclase (GGDEF)-like protein/PAS domain S-box-containing protein